MRRMQRNPRNPNEYSMWSFWVNVTRHEILRGVRGSAIQSPVSHAVRRILREQQDERRGGLVKTDRPKRRLAVNVKRKPERELGMWVEMWISTPRGFDLYHLAVRGEEFVRDFELGLPVKPVSFRVFHVGQLDGSRIREQLKRI